MHTLPQAFINFPYFSDKSNPIPIYCIEHSLSQSFVMLSAYEIGTPNPLRATSIGGIETVKKDSKRNTRENVGIVFLIVISLAILFSSICIFKYSLRARAVYDELVDYLDKTVSISKINYNPLFGVYELRPNELEILGEERKYKSLIWTFLFCDLVCFIFFGISAFFYFSVEYSRGLIRVLYWFFLLIGLLYSLIESTTFAILISPYSTKLPNSTIGLMDHAIPHNPGGLAQMENRFGCIFDQNLYETFKRQFNPKNTCDPFLLSSFIPNFLLLCFIVIRAVAILIFVTLLLIPNAKINTVISEWVQNMKPAIHYQKNVEKSKKAQGLPTYYNSPTKTTFGVKDQNIISSPLPTHIPPITPPLGQMDHTISYNNAALFAISGANVNYGMQNTAGGGPSSRCSEISIAKSAGDNFMQQDLMLRGSTHTTNSLVSEV